MCTFHEIELVISMLDLKYGNMTNMANIFDKLVNNSAFLCHKKIKLYNNAQLGFSLK